MFIEAKDDGAWRWWWQLDYWSYKSCKAPVKNHHHQQTNIHRDITNQISKCNWLTTSRPFLLWPELLTTPCSAASVINYLSHMCGLLTVVTPNLLHYPASSVGMRWSCQKFAFVQIRLAGVYWSNANSMNVNFFSLQCFDTVGWATRGHPACKKMDVGLLLVMIWLELCTTYSSSSPVVTTTSINTG